MTGCDAKFGVPSSLYVHLKKHREGSIKVKFKCAEEDCQKSFITKIKLIEHYKHSHNKKIGRFLIIYCGQMQGHAGGTIFFNFKSHRKIEKKNPLGNTIM